MQWFAALTDFSQHWFDWQFRAAFFSAFVLWAALGSGIRSPINRCAILVMGSWILLLFPLLFLWFPKVELAVLPFQVIKTGAYEQILLIVLLIACLLSSVLLVRFALALKALLTLHHSRLPVCTDDDELNHFVEQRDKLVDEQRAKLVQVFSEAVVNLGLAQYQHKIELSTSPLTQLPLTYGLILPSLVNRFTSDERAGLGKSYILLPESAMGWSKSRLMICLMHELWHIKRRDWLGQQVASIMQLCFVLNPLAKCIRQKTAEGMESSVDKLCVQSGVNPKDYAAELLLQARESNHAALGRSGLFSPTFFGEYRYGESGLQRRIGALTGEPFGWNTLPLMNSIGLFALLFFCALVFSSVKPVQFDEPASVEYQSSVYILPPNFLSFAEDLNDLNGMINKLDKNRAQVENWPSLRMPSIERTTPVYVDPKRDYQVEPRYSYSLLDRTDIEETLPETRASGDQQSDQHRTQEKILEAGTELNLHEDSFYLASLSDVKVALLPMPDFLAVPKYPAREESRNREGWVEIAFDLDDAGVPINPKIIGSSGSRYFEKAAMGAILESRYSMSSSPKVFLITEGLTQDYFFKLLQPGEKSQGEIDQERMAQGLIHQGSTKQENQGRVNQGKIDQGQVDQGQMIQGDMTQANSQTNPFPIDQTPEQPP